MKKYIEFLNKILQLKEIPAVKADENDRFAQLHSSITALADFKNKTIYVSKILTSEYAVYESIAHVMMHFYQLEHEPNIALYDYASLQPNDIISIREFHLRKPELQANAFAVVALANYFYVIPEFQDLDDDIVACIYQEAEDMVKRICNSVPGNLNL